MTRWFTGTFSSRFKQRRVPPRILPVSGGSMDFSDANQSGLIALLEDI
jgi:hypothetical protein